MRTTTVTEYRCEKCNHGERDLERAEAHELACYATSAMDKWATPTGPHREERVSIFQAWRKLDDRSRAALVEAMHEVFRDQLKRDQQ